MPKEAILSHCGLREDAVLAAGEEAPQMEALRRQNHTGRPCGAEGFTERPDGPLERVLRPRRRDRSGKGEVEERGGDDAELPNS